MSKFELRNAMLLRRKSLTPESAAKLSQQIRHKLRSSVNWGNVYKVHIYTSQTTLKEVDTLEICQMITNEFPAIEVTKGNPSKHALIPTGQYDLIIAPLVAFDAMGHRIGFGGGWYDRFLSTQPQALKVGLGYEWQRADVIPAEPHDELLDMVVTEARIYTQNKNALPK